MRLVSVWSDLYASTLALYAGGAGGHRWLVAAAPEHAPEAARTLAGLTGKGETVLLVSDDAAALESALREQSSALPGYGLAGRGLAGVLVLERHLTGGPAVTVAPRQAYEAQGGLSYRAGGHYPAWSDALGQTGTPGECVAASICAALGLPVRVCAPAELRSTLLAWWAATPHALAAGQDPARQSVSGIT